MPAFGPLTRRQLLRWGMASSTLLALPSLASAANSGRQTNTVRLTYGRGGLPLIAKQRGVFAQTLKKAGLNPEWVGPFPNHAPSMQAVIAGAADLSFGGSTTPALEALISNAPLVFTLFESVKPRTTAIIVKRNSAIKTVADLVGKTVAINHNGLGEFLLVAALEKYGIPRDQVNAINIDPPQAAPAFAEGQVDAWAMWSPQVDIARNNYDGRTIFLEERDLGYEIDFTSWLARREWAEANPDIIRVVNQAFQQEANWANNNIEKAEQIAQQAAGYDDRTRATLVSYQRHYHLYGNHDKAFLSRFQQAADWLSQRKIITAQVDITHYLA